MKNTIVTLTGPSCSGKSTLAKYLAYWGIPEVVSFTTREPRSDERTRGHGRAYDFLTRDEVAAFDKDSIIELVEFNGNQYGNTVHQLDCALTSGGGVATVVVEPSGVHHWREYAAKRPDLNIFSIYLRTDLNILMTRFSERLKTCNPDSALYELRRLENMVKVEHPTWEQAHTYDLVLHNLDSSARDTKEQVKGFLRYQFCRS